MGRYLHVIRGVSKVFAVKKDDIIAMKKHINFVLVYRKVTFGL